MDIVIKRHDEIVTRLAKTLGKFDCLIDIGSEETFCVEDVRHILEEIMYGES